MGAVISPSIEAVFREKCDKFLLQLYEDEYSTGSQQLKYELGAKLGLTKRDVDEVVKALEVENSIVRNTSTNVHVGITAKGDQMARAIKDGAILPDVHTDASDLDMKKLDDSTLKAIALIICGDEYGRRIPYYRSRQCIVDLFRSVGVDASALLKTEIRASRYKFMGADFTETAHIVDDMESYACSLLEQLNGTPGMARILLRLASPKEYISINRDNPLYNKEYHEIAIKLLNEVLYFEGYRLSLPNGVEPKMAAMESHLPLESNKRIRMEMPDISGVVTDAKLRGILEARWGEIVSCVQTGAYLSATIMIGSFLEGMLLDVALRNREAIYKLDELPMENGKKKPVEKYTLAELIDTFHKMGWIGEDVKKHSHALKDFRNIVHPREQMKYKHSPDMDTVSIDMVVVNAIVSDLATIGGRQ